MSVGDDQVRGLLDRIEAVRYGATAHNRHWDAEGTHGANCPGCWDARELTHLLHHLRDVINHDAVEQEALLVRLRRERDGLVQALEEIRDMTDQSEEHAINALADTALDVVELSMSDAGEPWPGFVDDAPELPF